MINQINSNKGQIYFPFIYALFIFILINNIIGLVPYSFASTSHFILTFSISFTVVLGATILGFQKHGLKFFYHVHGFEFQPFGDGTLLDLLFKETDPKFVNYQMDIFWIVFPGQDPVKLLQKYSNRWQLMHLKDMRKGTKTGALTGGTDVKNDAALGTGLMDMPAILRAAEKVGVKWYFIEDESPWSEKQIPQSLDYLKQVKL